MISMNPQEIKSTIKEYLAANQYGRSCIFQSDPNKFEHILLAVLLPKNKIVQMAKAAKVFDVKLQAVLFEKYLITDSILKQLISWKLNKFSKETIHALYRLLSTGKEKLTDFSEKYPLIDKCNLDEECLKGYAKASDKYIQSTIDDLMEKRASCGRGYLFEKRFDDMAAALILPVKKYKHPDLEKTTNNVDRILGSYYIEISDQKSDSGTIAYKAKVLQANYKITQKDGLEFICILDGPGWRARPEFQAIQITGIKVFTKDEVPKLFLLFCKEFGIKKSLSQLTRLWSSI